MEVAELKNGDDDFMGVLAGEDEQKNRQGGTGRVRMYNWCPTLTIYIVKKFSNRKDFEALV